MPKAARRVRHELRFRLAKVTSAERITPRMVRVTLHDEDFARFTSDAYDDHVKLFIAPPGEQLVMPVPGPNGLDFPEGAVRPEGRDYTPRSFDRERCEVVIDFVLHGDGPASSWAAAAKPGDTIGVGGPRGSFVVEGDFDWYLLAGDETALPAIGRRIEELPAGAKIFAYIEIADAAERQTFSTAADLELHWLERAANAPSLPDALRAARLPPGQGYAFVAGEAAASAAVRELLISRDIDPDNIKAAGYWRKGEADFDDGHVH